MLKLLTVVALALTLSPSAQSQTVKNHSDVLEGDFTPQKAMELLFGDSNPENIADWRPVSVPKEFNEFRDTSLRVSVLLDAAYVESGIPKHLLVTAAQPTEEGQYDCHACRTLIGAAVFSKTGRGWLTAKRELYLAALGEFGKPPTASLQQLGKDRFGFVLRENHTGSGMGEWVHVFGYSKGKIQKLFSARVESYFDFGSCEHASLATAWEQCEEFDGDFSVVPGNNPDYFDLVLTRDVTESGSRLIRRGKHTLRFAFVGDRYRQR